MRHAGGEEDKDPGVDDGVDGDEAQGLQVLLVRLVVIRVVDVNPDLKRWTDRERERGGGGEGEGGVIKSARQRQHGGKITQSTL